MTLQEKIAEKPEIDRINSSIESLVKILREELHKKCALLNVSGIPEVLVKLEELESEIMDL